MERRVIIDQLFEGEYALLLLGLLLSLVLLFCFFFPFITGFKLRRYLYLTPVEPDEEGESQREQELLSKQLSAIGIALARRGIPVAWRESSANTLPDVSEGEERGIPGAAPGKSAGEPAVYYEADKGAMLEIQQGAERFLLSLENCPSSSPASWRLTLSSEQLERGRVDEARLSVLEATGAGWLLLGIEAAMQSSQRSPLRWSRRPEGPLFSTPMSALQRRLIRLSPWR